MVIVQINGSYKIGSTGKIMADLNSVIEENGDSGYMVCAYSLQEQVNNLYISENLPYNIAVRKNIARSRVTGIMGYSSSLETKKIVEWIEDKKPDIIHLHNIHGDWINIGILFNYLKRAESKIIWTLHDCWAFTGRCSHFELCGCDKWKNGCYDCKNKNVYPITYFFDFSKKMYEDKKQQFCGIKNMTIVTPSYWLAEYVRESFLGEYNIETIHNGIDLSNFYPRKKKSKYLYQCREKKIILGVSNSWSEYKGLYDFYKLNEILEKDKFQIFLVGLNKSQLKAVPSGILAIGRTNNVEELAELYSNADVFVNPTYQDNYPTTNLESIACGTPVITYETGGSIESINESTGIVVKQGDVNALAGAIIQIKKNEAVCVEHAKKNFDKHDKYIDYIRLYKE